MNWLVFALAAYVMVALETGLRALLGVSGPDGAYPSFMLILAVYVALLAPAQVVPWALLVLGVLVDLQMGPVPEAAILGPAALGYLFGAYVMLQLRVLVFRESVITLAALVFATGIFVQLVIVGLYTMRGLPWLTAQPIEGWGAADQLVRRFFILLYTTVVALPVGALLLRTTPIWGFPNRGRDHRAS
ncbi:MAG: hypothetical protein ACODAQ_05810 [Phycisphaeraceae bacterium]